MNIQLSAKTYDRAKWGVQVVLPAIATLYLGLSDFWNLPNPLAVVGTITLVTTFLGTILGISNLQYRKENEPVAGVLSSSSADEETLMPNLDLTLTKDPAELLTKKTVTFHVR